MGQFLLTANGIQQILNGIEVDLTDVHQKNQFLVVSLVLYLESMNRVVVVCSGR